MSGLDIATQQSPSRQRTKRIAESAEPCVVPREIGNEVLNPLLTITAPFRFVRMCIIKLIRRLGVSILLRKQRIYWKDTLSKAFRKSSFTLRIAGLFPDIVCIIISEMTLPMFSLLLPLT